MPRSVISIVGSSLALILPGCLSLLDDPYLLKPSPGRAVRTFEADLAAVAPATLPALDEQSIRPRWLALRGGGTAGTAIQPDGFAMPRTNAELSRSLEVVRTHEAGHIDGKPVEFVPVLVNYKGTTKDGRSVTLVARVDPSAKARTTVFAKVGNGKDKADAEGLLDRIAGRIKAKAIPDPAPNSTTPGDVGGGKP